MVYVSSSVGNDANDGLSEARPKRTLAAGYALLRSGSPDWLLLKRGDAWRESFPGWGKSGPTGSEAMVVTGYGSGPRPQLLTGSSTALYIDGDTSTNLAIVGLRLEADNWS